MDLEAGEVTPEQNVGGSEKKLSRFALPDTGHLGFAELGVSSESSFTEPESCWADEAEALNWQACAGLLRVRICLARACQVCNPWDERVSICQSFIFLSEKKGLKYYNFW